MFRVDGIGYGIGQQSQLTMSKGVYNKDNLSFTSSNVLSNNPVGTITDLSVGKEVHGINFFRVAKDILHDVIVLFTFNDKGEMNGKLNASKGSQIYDSIERLAKKQKKIKGKI